MIDCYFPCWKFLREYNRENQISLLFPARSACRRLCGAKLAQSYPSIYPTGVTRYDPDKAHNSYILLPILTGRPRDRTALLSVPKSLRLIDMNGNVVHEWNSVRSWQRYRLLPNCNVQAIVDDGAGVGGRNAIVEYDWDGNEVWRWSPKGPRSDQWRWFYTPYYLHHDFAGQPNGELLAMYSIPVPKEKLEVVEDLDWPYFVVIDKDSGEVVYKGSHDYKGGGARQHEAHMIPKGMPGRGIFSFLTMAPMRPTKAISVQPS